MHGDISKRIFLWYLPGAEGAQARAPCEARGIKGHPIPPRGWILNNGRICVEGVVGRMINRFKSRRVYRDHSLFSLNDPESFRGPKITGGQILRRNLPSLR
jgi:hypothetical protein